MNCTVYCVSDVEGLLSSRGGGGGGGADILAPGLQFLPLALFGPLTGFPAVSLQSSQGGQL